MDPAKYKIHFTHQAVQAQAVHKKPSLCTKAALDVFSN